MDWRPSSPECPLAVHDRPIGLRSTIPANYGNYGGRLPYLIENILRLLSVQFDAAEDVLARREHRFGQREVRRQLQSVLLHHFET